MSASISIPISDRVARRSTLLAWGSSLALAAGVVGAGVADSQPLPVHGWAAVFLGLAVASDVHENRIPNWLTLPALGLALVFSPLVGATGGFTDAFAGAGLGLLIGIGPYALGGVGAGDVKAMMALGAWLGLAAFGSAAAWAVVAGALLAIGALVLRAELGSYLRRWARNLWLSLAARRIHYEPPVSGSRAAHGIPFAVALAMGVALHWLSGGAW